MTDNEHGNGDQDDRAPAEKLRPKHNTKATAMGRLYHVCTVVAWLSVAAVVLVLVLVGMIFADLNASCVRSVCTERAIERAFAGTGDAFSFFIAVFIISRTARYVIGPRP